MKELVKQTRRVEELTQEYGQAITLVEKETRRNELIAARIELNHLARKYNR